MTRVRQHAPAGLPAPPTRPIAARRSWSKRKLLPEFNRRRLLAISGATALEATRVGKFTDNDRIEAGIANKPFCDPHGFRVVARDRNSKLRVRTVRFAGEDFVAQRVERADDLRARQIFLRNDANPLFLHLVSE